MSETIRGAVARREDGPEKDPGIAAVERDLRKSKQWFDSVAPRHIDPDQFVSLCLGVVRKGDDYLKRALVQAPWSFMRAASECARLGLVPGETYFFVAFFNSRDKIYEVTGIVSWKGEVDQIYRAGGVTAVHCHTVRANDTFIWRPGQMDLPHHVIHANEFGQEGLAGTDDRGPLTGVYAYAAMAGGGYSQPAVLGRSEIARHRSFAKTDKFWGPGWPDEGPHTPDMWRKTAIHRLFDLVPHSAEYLAASMRAAAADGTMPAVTDAPERKEIDGPGPAPGEPGHAVAGEVEPGPPGEHAPEAEPEQPRAGAEPEPDRGAEPPARYTQADRRDALGRIRAAFREYGFGGGSDEPVRLAVLTGLMNGGSPSAGYLDPGRLTPAAAVQAAGLLEDWLAGLFEDPGLGSITTQITAFARKVIEQVSSHEQQAG